MDLQPLLLGMDWMDPFWLLDRFGPALFWLSLVIIFVECGLFFPFLPGDTLLFAMGLFFATEQIDLFPGPPWVELVVALALFTSPAIGGNVAGYEIGRKVGPPLYERDGRILKRKYFDQTTAFFDKHGNKALVIGRFVPFVRTYITVVAGVTRMDRRRFFLWSLVGADRLGLSDHPARLLPRLGVPEPRRADRQADHRHPGVLPAPDRLGVVAAQAHQRPRGRRQRPRRRARPRHRRSGRLSGVQLGTGEDRADLETHVGQRVLALAGDRSIAQTTISTTAPSARSAAVASRTAPPVVMTSSISVTRRPVDVRALGQLAGAVRLGLLAHEEGGSAGAGTDHGGDRDAAELEAAQQLGVRGGSRSSIWSATRASRAGWASKRYLSK